MSNNNIILIPSTNSEDLITGVFSNFFVISSATETLDSDVVVWDFNNVANMHPLFSVSLALYAKFCDKQIEIINARPKIERYLEDIRFKDIADVTTESTLSNVELKYKDKSYIPICSFRANDDKAQQTLQKLIQKQSKADDITTPLSYILGELICNIAQHAEVNDVFFYSEYTASDDSINICIADNGIGIFGSYVKANKYLAEVGDNDADALKIANEGYSTKNLPAAENRGFGISTSRNMLVKGLHGGFYMMSGSALQISEFGKPDKFLELPTNVEWQGTLIFLRIPCKAQPNFVYTDYLE